MLKLTFLLISFFLGAIPFGYIVAKKIKGVDIRNYGSGNIGATNIFRVLGKKWGIVVFILDFLKGFAVVFLAFFLREFQPYFFIFLGIAAVSGHNWTPFLGFRGGKGVATSLGVLLALSFSFTSLRLILPFTLLSWLVVFLLSKIVAVASLAAGFIFLVLSLFISQSIEIKILAFIFLLFLLIRHKKNIEKLLKGKRGNYILGLEKKGENYGKKSKQSGRKKKGT